jgi:putative dimethyl sulfoxide reductase chaperone
MELANETRLTEQELAEIAQARAQFMAFLNVHFTTLPDVAFVQQIQSDEYTGLLEVLSADDSGAGIAAGARLMGEYIRSARGLDASQVSTALGVDRTRLYRGVSPQYGPPPPNEAVWSKGTEPISAQLLALAEIYRQAQLEVAPDARERLDYIGVELDFAYKLAKREVEAWRSGDTANARKALEQQAAFFRDHLGQWVPAFVERARTYVETDFYRGHLQMLETFLAHERERLDALLVETADRSKP